MLNDPKQPYNDLPLLPPQTDLDDPKLLKKSNKATRALFRLNGETLLLPNPMLLTQPLITQEALQSSEIEDIHTTVEEVFEAELFDRQNTGPQKEVLHYKEALLRGANIIRERQVISTNTMIELQNIIEPKRPGVRKLPGTAIANQKTGEIIYTPPEGYDRLMGLLSNLGEFVHNTEEDYDPLIKAIVAHYQFEAIHPFRDGNGRTGRILLVLHLMLDEMLDLPLLFVSEYINQNKSEYYRLLRGVTERQEWTAYIFFMLDAFEQQAIVTNHRIVVIKALMDTVKATTYDLNMPERLGDLVFSYPIVTISKVKEEMGVSRQTASTYLKRLEEAGQLESKKIKKELLFFNRNFLQALSHA
jgi:Fic family protein